MADVDFDDFDAGYGAPMAAQNRVSRMVNIAGAVSSVALVIGLGIWGYNLAVRDVNGVPVIRAMSGPMRIAPENPGGEVADHQGLAVNDVAAIGIAAPPPERLVLAPRPPDLTDEDVAGLASGQIPQAEAATAPVMPAPIEAPQVIEARSASPAVPVLPMADDPVAAALQPVAAPEPVAASAPATAADPTQDAVAQALAEALGEDGPLEDVVTMDATDPAEEIAALAPVVEPEAGTVPAEDTEAEVAPKQRPRARPAAIAAAEPAAAAADEEQPSLAAPVAAAPAAEIDPATLTEGTRLVQLGAFDTAEDARAEWTKLLNQYGDLLSAKSLVVQSAESGGRTFYRLRAAGFATEDEARALCTSLLERNASCIPVAHR